MSIEEILVNVVFYLFAGGAVVASIAVALSQNIIRSAFALLGVLFAAAALYAFMRADFVVAAQIIIYVGGILVLIIFAVMLTHKITDVNASNDSVPGPAAVFAVLCILFALVVIIGTWKWDREPEADPVSGEAQFLAGTPKERVARLAVKLTHPDKTGIHPGDGLAGTMVHVNYTVTAAPEGAVTARMELLYAPTPKKNEKNPPPPAWSRVAHADTLVSEESGMLRATNLKPGDYRWRMSFNGATGPLVLGVGTCPLCGSTGKPGEKCGNTDCKSRVPAPACPTCGATGEAGEACATAGCKSIVASEMACTLCKTMGKAGGACPKPDCNPLLSMARVVCATCGVEGPAKGSCTKEGCKGRGKPMVPMPWRIHGTPFHAEAGLTRPLGMALMNRYLLPFEVISVLLLAALVGAAYLARKEVKGA